MSGRARAPSAPPAGEACAASRLSRPPQALHTARRSGSSPRKPRVPAGRRRRCRFRRLSTCSSCQGCGSPPAQGTRQPPARPACRGCPSGASASPPQPTLPQRRRRSEPEIAGCGKVAESGWRMWTATADCRRGLVRSPARGQLSSGTCRSLLASSSMLTSLKVTTRTFLTNLAGRYISQTQASCMVTSKNTSPLSAVRTLRSTSLVNARRDETALAGDGADAPFLPEPGECLLDGADADVELHGEVGQGGEPFPWQPLAGIDAAGEQAGDVLFELQRLSAAEWPCRQAGCYDAQRNHHLVIRRAFPYAPKFTQQGADLRKQAVLLVFL